VGCGYGTNTIFFGSKGMQATGVDLSPEAIAEAERRRDAAGAPASHAAACSPDTMVIAQGLCMRRKRAVAAVGHSLTAGCEEGRCWPRLRMGQLRGGLRVPLFTSPQHGGPPTRARAAGSPAAEKVDFKAGSVTELPAVFGERKFGSALDSALYHCLDDATNEKYLAALHKQAGLHGTCLRDHGSSLGCLSPTLPAMQQQGSLLHVVHPRACLACASQSWYRK